jgi:hypothetical protein
MSATKLKCGILLRDLLFADGRTLLANGWMMMSLGAWLKL